MAIPQRKGTGAAGGLMTRNTTPLTADGITGLDAITVMGAMACTRPENSHRRICNSSSWRCWQIGPHTVMR